MNMSSDITIDYGDKTVDHIDALIVGTGELREKLGKNLSNRGLVSASCRSVQDIDLSLSPDFIFWIPQSKGEKPHEAFLNFVKSLGARLTIVSCDEKNSRIIESCLAHDLDAREVVLHDLYGPGVTVSRIASLWSNVADGIIAVPEHDTLRIAPLSIDDAVDVLCLAAFSSQTYSKVVDISGSEALTLLSFAYKLRDSVARALGKSPKIIESKTIYKEIMPHQELMIERDHAFALLSWRPEVNLREGLDALAISEVGRKKKINVNLPPQMKNGGASHQDSSRRPDRSAMAIALALIGCFLFVVITPLMTVRAIEQSVRNLLLQISLASSQGNSEEVASLQSRIRMLSNIGVRFNLFSDQKNATFLSQAPETADVEEDIGRMFFALRSLVESVVGEHSDSSASLLKNLGSSSTKLLGARMLSPELHRLVSYGRDFLPLLPWALGMEGKRTFALVVENSSELRPTGGFMSAIGFMTFEKGKLLDLSFLDVYQLDGQLTGKEKPPDQIRKVLGEQNWLLRDANWNPDAPASAVQIQKMINRSTGRTVDGMVFLPTNALATILAATGPVTLPGGEVINASNLMERTTFGTNANLETGEQLDTMVLVVQALRNTLDASNAINLMKGIVSALQSGDLLVIAYGAPAALDLSRLGVDGSIRNAQCPLQFQGSPCLADSVFVVDANLGVNKADYFLKRKRSLDIMAAPNASMTSVLTLHYQNLSPSDNRPGGNYRGYTRVYLPGTAVISSIIDVKADRQIEVESDESIELEHHVVGFYLDIPYGTEKMIKITYRNQQPMQMSSKTASYALLVQKQPGVTDAPMTVTVRYPRAMTPIAVFPETTVSSDSLQFSLSGKKTESVAVSFSSM